MSGSSGLAFEWPRGAEDLFTHRAGDLERSAEILQRLRAGENPAGGQARFLEILDDQEDLVATIEGWAGGLGLGRRTERIVAFGVGGSSLGPRLLVEALGSNGIPVDFVDSIDPDRIEALWRGIDPRRTQFLFTSKSGGTSETVLQYADTLGRLDAARLEPADHVSLITGSRGYLRSEARRLGLFTFPVPEGVGGRWSVLSAVGLVPAALAGIDLGGLLAGACRWLEEALARPPSEEPAARLAVLLHEMATVQGRRVLCPFVYSERLASLGAWMTQLVMESLGKESCGGLTVLAARGTADQHSILQDLAQGHSDKVVLFVHPRRREADISLAEDLPGKGAPAALAGTTFGAVLDACRRGTRESLESAGRPTVGLSIDSLSTGSLGALLVYFETVVALLGSLFGVDAFDQPGVEDSKRRTIRELEG